MYDAIPQIIRFGDFIHDIDLSFFSKYYKSCGYNYLYEKEEHYRLLVYISSLMNNIKILDAGSHHGCSSLALAQNPTNYVNGYDINSYSIPYRGQVKNITIHQNDALHLQPHIIKESQLIILDIDPHSGLEEMSFVKLLIKYRYRGLLICDDIRCNQGMSRFWEWIPKYKLDITKHGHFSGTGIVSFNPYVCRYVIS